MGEHDLFKSWPRFRQPLRTTLLNATLAVTALLFISCSVAPTIQDAEVVTDDTRIVFGSVDVFGKKGKKLKWGSGWTGHNYFYLTILPVGSSEAITYQLDKDGMFFWALEPGDYMLLGYQWTKEGIRSGRFGADFNVPATGGDVYLGSIVIQSIGYALIPEIEDRFELISSAYDAKFPQRQGTAVKHLIEMPGPIGTSSSFRHECHADWKIECSKRYQGVTPLSPEISTSGFPLVESLQPGFRWQPSSRDDVSYDFILYEAAAYSVSGMIENSYMRGHQVAYVENLDEASWAPDVPLKPDTRYFWSVRLREGDIVSSWSTHSHFTFLILAWSSGYGQWFQFKTP